VTGVPTGPEVVDKLLIVGAARETFTVVADPVLTLKEGVVTEGYPDFDTASE
jgi:hypothetical protein